MVLTLSNENCYQFHMITFIFVSTLEINIYILYKEIDCIGFSEHLQAFHFNFIIPGW